MTNTVKKSLLLSGFIYSNSNSNSNTTTQPTRENEKEKWNQKSAQFT